MGKPFSVLRKSFLWENKNEKKKQKKKKNKNSPIQDQAHHCFHYQKKTYEQIVKLKDVLIARQQ